VSVEQLEARILLHTKNGGQPPAKNAATGGEPVYLQSGEFYYTKVDLVIPGRGLNWEFERTYLSQLVNTNPLGPGWQFNYNRRLELVTAAHLAEYQITDPNAQPGDIMRMDDEARLDFYHKLADGSFQAPVGLFTSLVNNADGTFTERDQTGMTYFYGALDVNGTAQLMRESDRDGNTLTFTVNGRGYLSRVVDTLGRPINYIYDSNGMLSRVTDFLGRSITFQHDPNTGDLLAVTSPAVTGTPNGNDFPGGKTERYTYSQGSTDERLNHKLLTITSPNEVAVGASVNSLVVSYGTDSTAFDFNRVTTEQYGGTNASGVPAGGTTGFQFNYQKLSSSVGQNDFTTPVSQTTVTDRDGNIVQYQFNQLGNTVQKEQFANRHVRPSDPAFFLTTYAYNGDGLMTQETLPDGNTTQWQYDSNNPDRFEQGNLLSVTRSPDAARGGDQTMLVTTSTYEPIYNQVRTVTDPRGNDPNYVPPNGGSNSPARYTTTRFFDYQESTELAANAPNDRLDMDGSGGLVNQSPLIAVDPNVLTTEVWLVQILGLPEDASGLTELRSRLQASGVQLGLGDLNGDGDTTPRVAGDIIRIDHPTVNLLPGSNQAMLTGSTLQPIVEQYTFNQFGQVVTKTDPEGNVIQYVYYPEQDPTGDGDIDNPMGDPNTGGYLNQVTIDAVSAPGRDNGTNPTPANIRHTYLYDDVGNVTREIDGRGIATDLVYNQLNQVVQIVHAAAHGLYGPDPNEPVPLTDFQYLERFFYDFNNNVVLHQVEDRGNTSGVQGNPSVGDVPAFLVQTSGTSTGSNSATTLNDTTQSWVADQWAGRTVQIVSGTGAGQVRTITGNSATQLTLATPWDTIPDANSTYAILSIAPAFLTLRSGTSTGGNGAMTLVDTTQNWQSNQWAGLSLEITGGLGAGQIRTIARNSATQLNLATAWNVKPNATSTYAILSDANAGHTAFVDTVAKYDILNHQIEMLQEVGTSAGIGPEFLRTRYRYDPNGNLVLVIQPEGNASASIYDERNLLFQTISGATAPPPLAQLALGDPTNYAVRGGLPATVTDNYDLNGNLIETVAADDTDSSLANNSKLASGTSTGGNTATTLNDTSASWMPNQWEGRTVAIISGTGAGQVGTIAANTNNQLTLATPWTNIPDATSVYAFQGDRRRFVYDGFDRLTSTIDSVANQMVYQYDPAGNMVQVTHFGPVDGPSPTSDGPDVLPGPVSLGGVIQTGNLVNSNLLSATETLYDEMNRPYQVDQVLFVNTIPTARPLDVAEGGLGLGTGKIDLNPGDTGAIPGITGINILGRVADRTEYDRNSRVTFTVQDDGDTSQTLYDGANRVIKTVDPEGNIVETAYDGNSNVIETAQMDLAQVAGVNAEVFLTTSFWDSLNRLQRRVDNLGQTMDYRYDSRNNLVAMADADGPLNGATINRRAFAGGVLTVNSINDFGNVTLYFYDGINRLIRQEVILTASGQGDGTHIGASIFGVKNDPSAPESFTPTPDTNQGGGDGIIRTGYLWDQNSLQVALLDDQGNVTLYLHDDLNRTVVEAYGLTVNSTFSNFAILGTRAVATPTAATTKHPAIIEYELINAQLFADRARIHAVFALFPSLANRLDSPTSNIYGYDPDGNLLIREDENGTRVYSRFDAANRRIDVHTFPVVPNDPVVGTTEQTYQYDGLSRVVRATDNNDPTTTADDSDIRYAYDSLGRVIEERQQIGAEPVMVISTGWHAENLRSRLVYSNSRVLVFTYDHLDRLATVGDQGATLPIAEYDYIGADRVLERIYPQNGTRETFLDDAGTTDVGYDGLRRPVQLRDVRDGDHSLIVGFTYTYDRMNNKLSEGKLHDPGNSETYAYDSAYRLVSFIRAPGGITPLQSTWSLDGAGNWQQVDGFSRQYSSTNELIQKSDPAAANYVYDKNGNLVDDGTFTYQWDFQNRLRVVTRKADGAIVADYTYDAENRRVRKVVSNSGSLDGTTDFAYDGWRAIEERNGAHVLVQQYVFGVYLDEPVVLDRNLNGDQTATGKGDQRLFYYQNTQFAVFALAGKKGKIVEGYQYDAYGRQTVFGPGANGVVDFDGDDTVTIGGESGVANPYLYTGQRLDSETGLYYYKNRYYSPDLGRFVGRDPIGVAGGINLYAYVRDNPMTGKDVLGLQDYGNANLVTNASASFSSNTINLNLTLPGLSQTSSNPSQSFPLQLPTQSSLGDVTSSANGTPYLSTVNSPAAYNASPETAARSADIGVVVGLMSLAILATPLVVGAALAAPEGLPAAADYLALQANGINYAVMMNPEAIPWITGGAAFLYEQVTGAQGGPPNVTEAPEQFFTGLGALIDYIKELVAEGGKKECP
jgi:RHS repeat-associated protein